jgi:hypothetical protein
MGTAGCWAALGALVSSVALAQETAVELVEHIGMCRQKAISPWRRMPKKHDVDAIFWFGMLRMLEKRLPNAKWCVGSHEAKFLEGGRTLLVDIKHTPRLKCGGARFIKPTAAWLLRRDDVALTHYPMTFLGVVTGLKAQWKVFVWCDHDWIELFVLRVWGAIKNNFGFYTDCEKSFMEQLGNFNHAVIATRRNEQLDRHVIQKCWW